jgi:hypothetical protein
MLEIDAFLSFCCSFLEIMEHPKFAALTQLYHSIEQTEGEKENKCLAFLMLNCLDLGANKLSKHQDKSPLP